MCVSLCSISTFKMTVHLKLPVNNQDGIELERTEDHESDGRLLLCIPCRIQLYCSGEVIVSHRYNKTAFRTD